VDEEDFSKVIKIILKGGDPNELNDINQTPLMLTDTFFIAKFLIEHGADVNLLDKYGRSALTYASDPWMTKLLIDEGADIDVVVDGNSSILEYTYDNLINGAYKILLLMQAGAKNHLKYHQEIQETYEEALKDSDLIGQFNKIWTSKNKKYRKFHKEVITPVSNGINSINHCKPA
jgi:ankyrin repeat protein